MCGVRKRPARYHKASGRAPWDTALSRLHGKGLTDERLAELLNLLTVPLILRFNKEGWLLERVEDLAGDILPFAALHWTVRQVGYHRRRLGLTANRAGTEAARAALHLSRRYYQSDAGWGHLLSDVDLGTPGILLRRRECQVLCLLRDQGPMSRQQLCQAIGTDRQRLRSRGVSILARLLREGLIQVVRSPGSPLAYGLTEAACKAQAGTSTRKTSIDALYG